MTSLPASSLCTWKTFFGWLDYGGFPPRVNTRCQPHQLVIHLHLWLWMHKQFTAHLRSLPLMKTPIPHHEKGKVRSWAVLTWPFPVLKTPLVITKKTNTSNLPSCMVFCKTSCDLFLYVLPFLEFLIWACRTKPVHLLLDSLLNLRCLFYFTP